MTAIGVCSSSAPAAGAYTAVGIAFALLFLTPLLFHLPTAALAATIIVAVLSLVDLGVPPPTCAFSRFVFAAMAATTVVTLGWGVEAGIVTGVLLSVLLHLWRTSGSVLLRAIERSSRSASPVPNCAVPRRP